MEHSLRQLSINTLCYKDDLKYLQGYMACLPANCEVNLMFTEGADVANATVEPLTDLIVDGKKILSRQTDTGGGVLNLYKYTYPKIAKEGGIAVDKFSFGHAKNELIKLAKRDWILNLDLDERIIIEPDEFDMIFNLKSEVGGLFVTLVSYVFPTKHDVEDANAKRMVRIFRNKANIKFSGTVHEQIADSIIYSGLLLVATGILIKHRGYEGQNRQDLINKLARNNAYLFKDLAANPRNVYNLNKVLETLSLFKKNKII